MAGKGYDSTEDRETLSHMKLKSRIMHKAQKNRPLTGRETAVNKAISKLRYAVGRTFGSMHRWFGAGIARYVGLAKTHTQHIMETIAYNLYRTPGIIVPNCMWVRESLSWCFQHDFCSLRALPFSTLGMSRFE